MHKANAKSMKYTLRLTSSLTFLLVLFSHPHPRVHRYVKQPSAERAWRSGKRYL